MNLNLYGYGQPDDAQWIMVDLGVTFADPSMPGVDVMMPDPAFIEEHRDSLLGIVLTHAHEDHLGAVQYLWPRFGCPVYATPFTAAVLRRKLGEVDWGRDVPIIEVPLGATFSMGPFDLELITLTHSIPEPNAIAIRTEHGTVLHTGDWKFDAAPVVGDTPDIKRLRELGDEGVLAMVCDSTNVFSPGDSGSEGDLKDSLSKVIAGCTGRVAVACFASNIARLHTVAEAAHENGRDVVLAGRSLYRMVAAAKETGYLPEDMVFVDESEAGYIPRDKCLLICTGSQGEPRAALSRIASGDHPRVSMDDGDTVIFSSRVIPGNEVSISQLQNQLASRNINIITWQDAFVHVSGHPARDELTEMYHLAKPQIAVPVHGEARHMIEHAKLARECQVQQAIVSENGSMISLTPGKVGVVDQVPSGRLALEGNRLVPLNGELVRRRRQALFNGFVVATVVLDEDGELFEDPQISASGLLEVGEHDLEEAALAAIEDCVENMPAKAKDQDAVAEETIRIALRRLFRSMLDKKPITIIHLVRV
ncbi:MAG: ribonuclease J [Rhodospirillales bacterium]|nr:ribonuclease J [Rhodospirillales bacterium]MBT4040815.1 ribonuclease J [Rhodospirillales bacterium]MBT4625084.1 ribonuclease J [Rhodospirillales bacterium]MBT5352981.1 ribonuclease J [Rhodospirillales bacterium]MBT5520342.1 ribonuclease J [Rhodospirillales bacterium]